LYRPTHFDNLLKRNLQNKFVHRKRLIFYRATHYMEMRCTQTEHIYAMAILSVGLSVTQSRASSKWWLNFLAVLWPRYSAIYWNWSTVQGHLRSHQLV